MTTSAHRSLGRLFLVLFCAALGACQAAYGDYKTGEVAAGVGGGGSTSPSGGNGGAKPGGASSVGGSNGGNANGGATSGSACSPEKSHRCTETAIETCVNAKWVSDTSCSRPLCNATTGTCMLCAPGGNRCLAFNLQTCSSSGTEWTTTAQCDTSVYCDAITDTCFTCLPGEAFCDGASLYSCNAKQNGWGVVDCGDPDLCDARAQACVPPCPDTDWVSCNGASLIGCDSNHHHIQLDMCASSQLCTKTVDDKIGDPSGWTGKCEAGCTPGAYQCNPSNPAELLACPPSGLAWEHVETCLTPELCDATNKKCDAGCGVAPGTYRCEDAKLELCRADGTGFDTLKTCQDADHCNTQKHDCLACVPGESQCSGAVLQTCGADLTWSTVQTCGSPALCNATHGMCNEAGCTQVGLYKCVGASLQQCSSDLTTWAARDTCVTATLCDATNGRCTPPVCTTPGAYQCQGNTRQICDEATRNWKDVNTCATGQVCDLTDPSGCLGTCPTVPARCNSTFAQKCSIVNNLPQWQTTATCATSALCSVTNGAASCANATCAVNQYQCSGSALQKCNAGRNGWDTSKTCAAGEICDAAGGQCDICQSNTYTCNSLLQLQKCGSDGQTNTVVDNCPSAAYCYTSTDKLTGYCYRCAAGDSQCLGTSQIQTCATDRRSWNAATTCTNGCQDNAGSADYCAACPTANEVQCVQTSTPGTTRKCAADRSAWGATTTCTAGYGCVDSGTADYCAGTCVPNQSSCITGTPSTSLHVCNSDGKGYAATVSQCADTANLKVCVSGAFSGTSACPSATPNCVNGACFQCTGTTTACKDGSTLQTCSNGSWVTSVCPSGSPICSGGVCVPCTSASAATCNDGATRKYCASNNTWATQTCTSPTPNCVNGTCFQCLSSYVPTCVGSSVQICSAGTLTQTPCSGATPVCYAASATTAAVCSVCNASTQPTCLADGLTLRTCVNGSNADKLCNSLDPTKPACLNGACAQCNANSPATCPSSSTRMACNTTTGAWVTSSCPTATPVCTGAGTCVQCAPDSALVCTKSNQNNTWYDGQYSCTNNTINAPSCATGQICDQADKTCKAATCGVGQKVCASDTVLNTCNSTRTGWDATTCTGACYAGACVTCKPGSTKCVGDNGLQTCLSDGSGWGATTSVCADNWSQKACVNDAWSTTTTKACPSTAPVCSDGQCGPAACDIGQPRCDPLNANIVQVCNATRTGWVTQTTCSGATPVCQTSTKTCGCSSNSDCASGNVCSSNQCVAPTCSAGDTQCDPVNANIVQVCNATRTGWVTQTTCTAAAPVCQASTKTCGCSSNADCASGNVCSSNQCVAPTCSAGDTRCDPLNANIVQVCNSTRTDWVTQTTCSATTPVCQTSTKTCGCSSSPECPAATPICSANQCVQCLVSSECSGVTPICSSNGACIACSDSLPCPSGACQPDGSCLAS
jgi:hypothetical protein